MKTRVHLPVNLHPTGAFIRPFILSSTRQNIFPSPSRANNLRLLCYYCFRDTCFSFYLCFYRIDPRYFVIF